MHQLEYLILEYLKNMSDKDISTSSLVNLLFPAKDLPKNDFQSKKDERDVAFRKAKHHRKLLYHLNRLVEEDLIKITKTGNRGEKFFALNLNPDEELIIKKEHRRLVISRPALPALPDEGYENKGITSRFEKDSWTLRLNAVLLRTENFRSSKEFQEAMSNLYSVFNDAIGLYGFEELLQKMSYTEIASLLHYLANSSEDFNRKTTIILNICNVHDKKKIMEFIMLYLGTGSDNIELVINASIKGIQKGKSLFLDIVDAFSASGRKIYIKNSSLRLSPHFVGRAGPYSLSEHDWEHISQGGDICIPVASNSIAVDVKTFFEKGGVSKFRKMIGKVLGSLFIASTAQRTHPGTYLSNLYRLNKHHSNELYKAGRNYIRFWNYGWKEEHMDQEIMLDLIKSTKQEADDFCHTETSIFKACGIPTEFKVAFSCAFKSFSDDFSPQVFSRVKIENIENLYSTAMRSKLKAKEEISEVFDGGDRMRFVRMADIDKYDILKEIELILNVYKIPFFCYDFGCSRQDNMKLTSYF